MRPLPADGPTAPPRKNGELVFEEPWERDVFGLTMALCENGALDWEEFRARLISALAENPAAYWETWASALEEMVVDKRLVEGMELAEKAREMAVAFHHDHHDL
jgi:nitrile hydratase accessory protein